MIDLQDETDQLRDLETWKDRFIAAGLGLGAIFTAAWCGVLAGGAWWLAVHAW